MARAPCRLGAGYPDGCAPPPGGVPAAPPARRRHPGSETDACDVVYAALREAGLGEEDVVQLERLLATAILGFAASEAGGRFAAHSAAQLDADFALLQDMLGAAVSSAIEATARPR